MSASTYLAALGAATDGVLLVDHTGVIVYANPAAETCFSDASLIGQCLVDLSLLDRRTLCGIWRELSRVRRWSGRLSVRSSGPDLAVTIQHVAAQTNEAEHFCIVLHAAARAGEDRAEHAHNPQPTKLQRFASEIAHDFNNQIAVILNYTFLLLRQMPADSPFKEHVAEVQAAAWRASQVAQAIHRALVTQVLLPSGK